jgi:hypothetical protein
VRVEETQASVRYTGTWFPNVNGVHSGGSARGAMDVGSQATFTFSGTGVRWIGYRDEWSGYGRVLVDGRLSATVDTSASPQQAQAVLFSVTGLASGTHTISVEPSGQVGSKSTSVWIWVDAFEVVP